MNEDKKLEKLKKCPHCKNDFKDNSVCRFPQENNPGTIFFEIHKCVICSKLIVFQKSYFAKFSAGTIISKTVAINYVYPTIADTNIPIRIKEVFPRAAQIFRQSLEAKAQGLNELVGIGLRKSLEVLITDYLIAVQKENEDTILKLSLHKKIETLDSSLFASPCAMFAKEIGNDETHYQQRIDSNVDEMQKNIETLFMFMEGKLQIIKAEEALAVIEKNRSAN